MNVAYMTDSIVPLANIPVRSLLPQGGLPKQGRSPWNVVQAFASQEPP